MKEFPIGMRVRLDCKNCPGACKTNHLDTAWVVEDYYLSGADPNRIRVYCKKRHHHFGCPREHVYPIYAYHVEGNELHLEEPCR